MQNKITITICIIFFIFILAPFTSNIQIVLPLEKSCSVDTQCTFFYKECCNVCGINNGINKASVTFIQIANFFRCWPKYFLGCQQLSCKIKLPINETPACMNGICVIKPIPDCNNFCNRYYTGGYLLEETAKALNTTVDELIKECSCK